MMGIVLNSSGLIASLIRFLILYLNTWRKELINHFARKDGKTSKNKENGDAHDGEMKEASLPFELSLKRVFVLIVVGICVPILMIWNHVGFWLDDIFYRKWKLQRIERPLFMVGNARSGTTWIHRILAQDGIHFTSPKLWEICFAQSVTWRILFYRLGRLDRSMGSPLYSLARFVDKKVLGRATLHSIGFWQVEEDEWLMFNIGACQLAALIFPCIDDFSDLIYFDETASKETKALIFHYYKQSIQRHLYAHQLILSMYISNKKNGDASTAGGTKPRSISASSASSYEKLNGITTTGPGTLRRTSSSSIVNRPKVRYLAKNPTFTLRMQTIFEHFSDADVVVLVRDPFKAIPSMVSYIAYCWKIFNTPTEEYPHHDALTNMCSLHYSYPVEIRNSFPKFAKQISFLHYELCVRDLVKSFRGLYKHLGIQITGQMAANLNQEASLCRNFDSKHHALIQTVCKQSEQEFITKHQKAFDIYPVYLNKRQGKKSPTAKQEETLLRQK